MLDKPFRERRAALEKFFSAIEPHKIFLLSRSTNSPEAARKWLKQLGKGLDGIVAKRLDIPYRAGVGEGREVLLFDRDGDTLVKPVTQAQAARASTWHVGDAVQVDERGRLHHHQPQQEKSAERE